MKLTHLKSRSTEYLGLRPDRDQRHYRLCGQKEAGKSNLFEATYRIDHGEFEQKFLHENRVYVTWDGLAHNLAKIADRAAFAGMTNLYPDAKPKRLQNWVSPGTSICVVRGVRD